LESKDAGLTKNEGERTEIVASLGVFGTDEAFEAYAKYAKANAERKGGDLGQLVLDLRRSIFKTTTPMTAREASLTIWQDPRYLK
jgi:hypothetical protein